MKNLFEINSFNIIEDEENYYFFRALNMGDNSDVEQGITVDEDRKIKRIRTDRERYEGEPKYTEESILTLEEMNDHIKNQHRTDTNCISITSNANIAITYGRGSYTDKYVMIKIPKSEMGEKVHVAGEYMLREIEKRINEAVAGLTDEDKKKVLDIFGSIEEATEGEELKEIIKNRFTAKMGEMDAKKAHPRDGIVYSGPRIRISSYQDLDTEQMLEINKIYAKMSVLEYENILKNIIKHTSNSTLKKSIGSAFSSRELIHYGNISREEFLEVPKEYIDLFALIQQIDGIDKSQVDKLKVALLEKIQSGAKIQELPNIAQEPKTDISIEEMYEIIEGRVEYGKASSIVKNMFYLSKSRQNALRLASILNDLFGNNSEFEDIIEYIRENGFRIEPEIILRQSGQGVILSESVNMDLQKEEQGLVDEIKSLQSEELETVLQNGGLYNVREIITRTFGSDIETEKIDKTRYYAEAIMAKYNWQNIGIEEFRITEKNELIARLQEKNCIEIYNKLREIGIEENKIATVLINIVMRDGFHEQYKNGNLEELLNTRQDVLYNDINIEVVERFLGYYDIENTGIRLKDYQQRAYDRINSIFEDKKFAQVILPTGAGKSFVALAQMQKYAGEHPNEKMLYLAPQDEILNQIKKYIVEYVHGKKGTLGKKSIDKIIKEVFPNITFETYSGLLARRGNKVIKDKYGMIVLDELHRTGAKEWEGKVDKLLENQEDNVRVLGITATPTRDTDGRDMVDETAKKLGYTDEEIRKRKHIAANMSLENAIRMGYVVNPKLVYCKYDLISSGKMEELRERIEDIEDETKRAEELQKYNELRAKLNSEIDAEIGEEARTKLEDEARRNLENGIGKEEILRQNVKRGGKYIVFIPVSDQGDIEDEDGNRIGTKSGEDKILAYQEYLNKVFEGTEIVPELHSLLGSYSKEKNRKELDLFESDKSDKTKFMVVMNKANEGLHIDGVDGIIWFRALDKNSRILYLQQLGRAIYALDEDNPMQDEKRPTVIDLTNNSLTVKIEKDFENANVIDDLEALTIIIEWINMHGGVLPDRNSSNKQEQHYYAVLRRIQDKYSKYLDGFESFEDLTDEEKLRIQEIIELATEIDLWNIDLPPIEKSRGSREEFTPFTVEGVLRDFVELKDEIENNQRKTTYEELIDWLEKNNGKMPKGSFKEGKRQKEVSELTKEERYQQNLRIRWRKTREYSILNKYAGQSIENVPEDYREKIIKLRSYGLGGKSTYEQIIEWLETHEGKLPQRCFKKNGKKKKASELSEEERYQKRLADNWANTREFEIFKKYADQTIESIPMEYREKIIKLRELIATEKGAYEEIIEWLKSHNGKMPQSMSRKKVSKLTDEERYQSNLLQRWYWTEEYKIFKQYNEQPIESVPKEYREKIKQLRKLIIKEKTVYEEIIEWLEHHNGKLPQTHFKEKGEKGTKKVSELTEEERYQQNLRARWNKSNERKIMNDYAGQPIENVPEEYREKIKQLRNLIIKEKTIYEEMIEWLEQHNGKMPQARFKEKGKKESKKVSELTEEERYQQNLRDRWNKSSECKIMNDYAGKPIEEIPEEHQEIVKTMRNLGYGLTNFEEVMKFLRKNRRLPMQNNSKEERSLYNKWLKSEEKKIVDSYTGKSLEEIPEEDRELAKTIRSYGYSGKGKRLSQAKKQRDEAKDKNDEAKKLEEQVSEQLKKRGKNHEKQ